MKTICFFLSYSPVGKIPLYVIHYLNELNRFFDELWLVTNLNDTNSNESIQNNIHIYSVENEGYDFGMFYKCIQQINLNDYRQIACVNDSNILISGLKPVFEWAASQNSGYWGLIDSFEKPWFSVHNNCYHIQSHFVVFNSPAIQLLFEYFNSLDVDSILQEKDVPKLRRKVINDWEIGVSQFMLQKGIVGNTFVKSEDLQKKYGRKIKNATFDLYSQLIAEGYPLLKKKVIFREMKWKNYFTGRKRLKKTITRYGVKSLEPDKAINEILSAS